MCEFWNVVPNHEKIKSCIIYKLLTSINCADEKNQHKATQCACWPDGVNRMYVGKLPHLAYYLNIRQGTHMIICLHRWIVRSLSIYCTCSTPFITIREGWLFIPHLEKLLFLCLLLVHFCQRSSFRNKTTD